MTMTDPNLAVTGGPRLRNVISYVLGSLFRFLLRLAGRRLSTRIDQPAQRTHQPICYVPGAEAKPTSPPKAAETRGSYQCLVDYDSDLFSVRWSGSPQYPDLVGFPYLDSNAAGKISPLSLTPELDRIWKASKLHDHGAHASIRTTNGNNAFPILKLAHPDDSLSIKLIEREFNVLAELKKLELPVVDFDQQPITCDGVIYGYRMKRLTKLEPGEIHTRWKDVMGVFSLLHHAGFCHGDFNPSNIMKADNDRLIIIDFSFSGRIGSPVPPFMPTWRFPTGEYCLDQDVAALEGYALPN
ncbi:hypothetical protein XA68_16546 [Ophiocordyceps unilateralis]|uniref:non-specific serine/threonine protein kinase n=1 Tax=Ophiocordyceps unilateralis TaxID=268505 RepID=A0A2A9P5E6_OPHUN|nr:hypothetical protein XA68_16546 [Ophiocordyceps unilateralis]